MILFIDESGHDHRKSPYEVLAGVAVPQCELWPFVCSIRRLINQHFTERRVWDEREIKGARLLNKKRLSQSFGDEIAPDERRGLVREFYELNASKQPLRRRHFEAYGQACRLFCRDILQLCVLHSAAVLAAVMPPDRAPQLEDTLRADYACLFYQLYERASSDPARRALIVHDERDDSQCRELSRQLYAYYLGEGSVIASRVVPEPVFVKSHLTLGVLVADIVAYVIAWGFRHAEVLGALARPDLSEFAELICAINKIPVEEPPDLDAYGIVYLDDLSALDRWSNKKSG